MNDLRVESSPPPSHCCSCRDQRGCIRREGRVFGGSAPGEEGETSRAGSGSAAESRVQWAGVGGGDQGRGGAWSWGLGHHPSRWTRDSRSVAGASARSSCPCSSDTRTSALSAPPWPRSPAGSLLDDKGGQGQVVRMQGRVGLSFWTPMSSWGNTATKQ